MFKKWNISLNLPMVLDFLYANSVFEVFSWNVSTANYEGRLYCILRKFEMTNKFETFCIELWSDLGYFQTTSLWKIKIHGPKSWNCEEKQRTYWKTCVIQVVTRFLWQWRIICKIVKLLSLPWMSLQNVAIVVQMLPKFTYPLTCYRT